MGWFDEQIRQRKQSDQETFEESIFRMASVVLGKSMTGSLDDERISPWRSPAASMTRTRHWNSACGPTASCGAM